MPVFGEAGDIIQSVPGEVVSIFNPRQQLWKEHFAWEDLRVMGLTATGRATSHALDLNRLTMLAIRLEEKILGRHPPP